MSKSLKIPKRRRRENKTDYKSRFTLLKSGLRRIIIRRTNKYLVLASVESDESRDKVLNGVTSKELLKYGWDKKYFGSLKSVPGAYLTGVLMASKLDKGQKYVVDLGMARKGERIFAAVKGMIDAGIKINANHKVFPSKERLSGEHMKKELKSMIEKVKTKLEGKK
jgi:large subunit ribosomal protein L18